MVFMVIQCQISVSQEQAVDWSRQYFKGDGGKYFIICTLMISDVFT